MSQNQGHGPSAKHFNITINDGQALLIVHINGHVSFDYIAEIQSVSKQIATYSGAKFVILEMSHTIEVESKMIFSFAKIQKDIRDKGLQLRVCALPLKLRKKLLERGVLRESELCDNLANAVRSLLIKQRDEKRSGAGSGSGRGDPIAA